MCIVSKIPDEELIKISSEQYTSKAARLWATSAIAAAMDYLRGYIDYVEYLDELLFSAYVPERLAVHLVECVDLAEHNADIDELDDEIVEYHIEDIKEAPEVLCFAILHEVSSRLKERAVSN